MSDGARLAPEFRVAIDGRPVPAALRASITGVRWQTGLGAADRVELTLANEQLRWLDHPLLALDRDLALWVGYAPTPLEQVFVGQIVGTTASFPSGGLPTVTVAAQDRLQRLQRGEKVRWFAIPIPSITNIPLPDPLVATLVTVENQLLPLIDPVGATISVLLGGAEAFAAAEGPGAVQKVIRKQEGESDFDFLGRLCAENGLEMTVDHSGPFAGHRLHFFSPLDRLAPDLTLKYGRSLIDYSPRITNVGQIVSVTAFVWISAIKTDLAISVGWDWDRMALTIDVRPAVALLGTGPSHFLIGDPVTPFSAPRRIISELIPKLNRRLTGSGSTIGDPRIKGGSVLRLVGLGEQYGGLHRVTSATHTLDGSGYRTGFEVRKEIWFGSIPPLEQGAVPIRVLGEIPPEPTPLPPGAGLSPATTHEPEGQLGGLPLVGPPVPAGAIGEKL
jgi:hypothetical protein